MRHFSTSGRHPLRGRHNPWVEILNNWFTRKEKQNPSAVQQMSCFDQRQHYPRCLCVAVDGADVRDQQMVLANDSTDDLADGSSWRNIKWFWQLRFFKGFWLNGGLWDINFFPWKLFKWYSPVQRRSHGNIYIEKITNIGTSELCWDISGLFLDDRDFCAIDTPL